MPNLVGVWNPALSEEMIRKMLAKQLHRIRVPNVHYHEYIAAYPGFGVALLDHGIPENGRQPALSDDGRFALMLDGEFFNAHELKKQFRAELPRSDLSPPELCLQLILNQGEEGARLLNGLFSIALYDRKAGRVTLISDRYGFHPLFYSLRADVLVFGTEVKAICAVDPQSRGVDELGTLELFCYGSHVMDRTWLEGVRHLSPATILTVDGSGHRARSYWTYKYQESAPRLDQRNYVTVASILFDRAVERHMKGSHRFGIFLSGGYDSRAVAAATRKYHRPLTAYTFGYPESRDVRFAAMLAQRLGLEHHALSDRGPYLYRNCRSIVWRTEGMVPFASVTSIRYHKVMKERIDVILTGFLAEFGGSHTWPRLLLTRSRRGTIQVLFDRVLGKRLAGARRVLQPAFFQRVFGGLREQFEKSFEAIENEHPVNISDCWRYRYVQPRSTFHAPSIDRYLFEMRAPNNDYDYVDFLLTIPPTARLEQRVYKQMIAYSFPEIRDVPCTNSAVPIDPHFAREYAKMVLRYCGRKVGDPVVNLFRGKPALGREFRDLSEDFRTEPELITQILRPLFEAGVFPEAIFDRGGVEQIIREHYEHNARHESLLALLISWGLAAKCFLYEDLSDVPAEMYAP